MAGESFAWRPWNAEGEGRGKKLENDKGMWEVGDESWGILGLVWPKPGELPLLLCCYGELGWGLNGLG